MGNSFQAIRRQWSRIRYKKQKFWGTAAVALYVIVSWFFKIPCFYVRTFGLPCPGCGMTRAWFSVLHLHWKAAFHYHPLFWAVIPLYLYILFDGALFGKRWLDRTILITLAAAFVILEIIRLADPVQRAMLLGNHL